MNISLNTVSALYVNIGSETSLFLVLCVTHHPTRAPFVQFYGTECYAWHDARFFGFSKKRQCAILMGLG